MIPLVVLIVSAGVLRLAGLVGVATLSHWPHVVRFSLAIMFAFTGSTHFTGMKYDYAAMVPPPLTGQLWVIYLTGLLEIAGATGLIVRPTIRTAAICLIALLAAMFPANVYAAVHGVTFRGAPPAEVWTRSLIQVIFVGALFWSAVRRRG